MVGNYLLNMKFRCSIVVGFVIRLFNLCGTSCFPVFRGVEIVECWFDCLVCLVD